MSRTIEAVYDGEVLRPEEPLELQANTRVRITIETSTQSELLVSLSPCLCGNPLLPHRSYPLLTFFSIDPLLFFLPQKSGFSYHLE